MVPRHPLTRFWPHCFRLLRGFTHLDFRRAERGFRYRPMAVVEGGATLAMAAAILPAAGPFSAITGRWPGS